MRFSRIIFLMAVLLFFDNIAEAQVIAPYRRGGRTNTTIKPRVKDVKITDLNSLKDLPYITPEEKLDFRGIIAYNPVDYSDTKTKISKGFYIWSGEKWRKIYGATPTGSLKGDLEALHAIQLHPDNIRYATAKGFHKWDIDLENIENPKNMKLSGVFFRKINGEQRVIEVSLEDFNFQNITVNHGLEALVAFKVYYSDHAKEVNLELPNLANFYSAQNESLVKTYLDCPNLGFVSSNANYNQDVLDISKCQNVFSVSVFNTRITSLNLSKNRDLAYLDCYSNSLSSLDLSQNTKLINLKCHTNSLSALDVSYNTALRVIICSKNKITTLNVSKNKELSILDCSLNELKELDLSNNLKLAELSCNYNQLKTLDLSKNLSLTKVDCSVNRSLTSIDVSNSLVLNELRCADVKLSTLDLSRHPKLEILDISYTPLISIPKSIKICRNAFRKVVENSYKGLHMHDKDSNIYDLID